MMLATTKVENLDRFLKIFSTKGLEKRKLHGSKGASVPPLLHEAGHKGKPGAAKFVGKYSA